MWLTLFLLRLRLNRPFERLRYNYNLINLIKNYLWVAKNAAGHQTGTIMPTNNLPPTAGNNIKLANLQKLKEKIKQVSYKWCNCALSFACCFCFTQTKKIPLSLAQNKLDWKCYSFYFKMNLSHPRLGGEHECLKNLIKCPKNSENMPSTSLDVA